MILHDRVHVEVLTLGGEDAHGNPIEAWEDRGMVPAEVRPLGSDDTVAENVDRVITRYRFILKAGTAIPSNPTLSRFTWRGELYMAEGLIEQHTLHGRLHHYEAIGKQVLS